MKRKTFTIKWKGNVRELEFKFMMSLEQAAKNYARLEGLKLVSLVRQRGGIVITEFCRA